MRKLIPFLVLIGMFSTIENVKSAELIEASKYITNTLRTNANYSYGRDYITVSNVIAKIGSTREVDLLFDGGAWNVTNNVTFSSNIGIMFSAGTSFTNSTTTKRTITVNGYIEAINNRKLLYGNYLRFRGTPKTHELHAEWWGSYSNALEDVNNMGQKTLVSSTSYVMPDGKTASNNVTLKFNRGANLTGKKTFTVNGTIEAGHYQLFDETSLVTIDMQRNEHVVPQWWGAIVGDNTDDTKAISNAFRHARVYIPSGNKYIVKESISVANKIFVEGPATREAIIECQDLVPTGEAMFTFTGIGTQIKNLDLQRAGAGKTKYAILMSGQLSVLENMHFMYFDTNVFFSCNLGEIRNCSSEFAGAGYHVGGSISKYIGCYANWCTNGFKGATGPMKFISCHADNIKSNAYWISSSSDNYPSKIYKGYNAERCITYDQCSAEGITTAFRIDAPESYVRISEPYVSKGGGAITPEVFLNVVTTSQVRVYGMPDRGAEYASGKVLVLKGSSVPGTAIQFVNSDFPYNAGDNANVSYFDPAWGADQLSITRLPNSQLECYKQFITDYGQTNIYWSISEKQVGAICFGKIEIQNAKYPEFGGSIKGQGATVYYTGTASASTLNGYTWSDNTNLFCSLGIAGRVNNLTINLHPFISTGAITEVSIRAEFYSSARTNLTEAPRVWLNGIPPSYMGNR